MTAYKHCGLVPTPPSFVSEAKEKRKQQLAAVWERRKIIYAQYTKKLQAAHQRQKLS